MIVSDFLLLESTVSGHSEVKPPRREQGAADAANAFMGVR